MEPEKLAKYYSDHLVLAGKRWTTAATLSVLAFALAPSDGIYTILGADFDQEKFFIVLAVSLALANTSFCVAHYQALKLGGMLEDFLDMDPNAAEKIAGFPWRDYVYSFVQSGQNRTRPLVEWIENDTIRLAAYRFLKLFGNTLYFGLPAIALFSILISSTIDRPLEYVSSIIAMFGLFPTVVLANASRRFVISRKR